VTRGKRITLWVTAIAMVIVGTLHFVHADEFVRIVPAFLPAPLALVYISGVAEIAGGLGLLVERTRRFAAWGLIALFVAVFPANINMAVNHIPLGGAPPWAAWARLPFQVLFIWVAWWLGRQRQTD